MHLTTITRVLLLEDITQEGAVEQESSKDCREDIHAHRAPNCGWGLLCSEKDGVSSDLWVGRTILSSHSFVSLPQPSPPSKVQALQCWLMAVATVSLTRKCHVHLLSSATKSTSPCPMTAESRCEYALQNAQVQHLAHYKAASKMISLASIWESFYLSRYVLSSTTCKFRTKAFGQGISNLSVPQNLLESSLAR